MWRAAALLLCVLTGCNSLFGIHELAGDAGADSDLCVGACDCHVDTDCADPHAYCNDQITSRTCDCVAGYSAGEVGSACTWTGVVGDPELMQAPGPWVGSNGAIVDPNGSGESSVGVAVLADPGDNTCRDSPAVVQMITMPRRSRSEPLVMATTYRNSNGFNTPALTTAIASVWNESSLPETQSNWLTVRTCLGAGDYAAETTTGSGASVPLSAVGDTTRNPFCLNMQQEQFDLEVDALDIDLAHPGECPDPGTAINGDAEGSNGWTFDSIANTAGDGVVAGFVAGVGEGSSQGVELKLVQRCDDAAASVPVSVPVSDASGGPTLSIYHAANRNTLQLDLDRVELPLSGAGQPTVDRYCVPATLAGGVFALDAYISAPNDGGSNDTCADAINTSAVIDNVVLGNDPLCGGDPGIANPGFESGTSLIGDYASTGGSVAGVDDPHAHGGSRDLQLSVAATCADAYYEPFVVPPAFTTGAGPAVTFWYQASAGTSSIYVDSYGVAFTPTRDGTWYPGVACLDPTKGTRPQQPFFEIESASVSGQTCGTAIATETLLIDDLATTTLAMCPTQ